MTAFKEQGTLPFVVSSSATKMAFLFIAITICNLSTKEENLACFFQYKNVERSRFSEFDATCEK